MGIPFLTHSIHLFTRIRFGIMPYGILGRWVALHVFLSNFVATQKMLKKNTRPDFLLHTIKMKMILGKIVSGHIITFKVLGFTFPDKSAMHILSV